MLPAALASGPVIPTSGVGPALAQYRAPTLTVPSWHDRHFAVEPVHVRRLVGYDVPPVVLPPVTSTHEYWLAENWWFHKSSDEAPLCGVWQNTHSPSSACPVATCTLLVCSWKLCLVVVIEAAFALAAKTKSARNPNQGPSLGLRYSTVIPLSVPRWSVGRRCGALGLAVRRRRVHELVDVDTEVQSVGDVDAVLRVDRDPGRIGEEAGRVAGSGEEEQQLRFPVEDLDGGEERVDDVEVAEAVGSDALWLVELPEPVAALADLADELSLLVELDHPRVHGVGDEDSVRRDRHERREEEIALPVALLAELRLVLAAGESVHVDRVTRPVGRGGVGHVGEPRLGIDGDAGRALAVGELEGGERLAVAIEGERRLAIGDHHPDRFARDRHAHRRSAQRLARHGAQFAGGEVEEEERSDRLVADGEEIALRGHRHADRVIERHGRVDARHLAPGARERSFQVRGARIGANEPDALLGRGCRPGRHVVIRRRATEGPEHCRGEDFSCTAQNWPSHGRPLSSRIMPLRIDTHTRRSGVPARGAGCRNCAQTARWRSRWGKARVAPGGVGWARVLSYPEHW